MRGQLPVRRRGSRRVAAALAVAAIATSIAGAPAIAYHSNPNYGARGYVFLAHWQDTARLWITSGCTATEDSAFERVRASTAGTSEFSTRWPSGIRMAHGRCDSEVTYNMDIKIVYDDWTHSHPSKNAAGENHSVDAPRSWCDLWGSGGVNYPCGSHPSKVHVNTDWWNGQPSLSRQRLLMHETGHSLGLDHHCESNSIMNDGSLTCNNASWTSVMTYKATDRDGIYNMYTWCWKCP